VVEPIGIDGLATALRTGAREHIALVGGGGKTTALFALGQQLSGSTVLTTTTKMGRDRTGGNAVLFSPSDLELAEGLVHHQRVLAWGQDKGHKAAGVSPEACDRWFTMADNVVVEADGSHQRPFKAPRPFEPVIPSTSTMVVACVGSDALGRVIADQCQRPLRVAAAAGCSPYLRLTPERLAMVLLSDRGSRKECPAAARFVVLINKVDETHRRYVDELADIIGDAAPVVAIAEFDPSQSPETRGST